MSIPMFKSTSVPISQQPDAREPCCLFAYTQTHSRDKQDVVTALYLVGLLAFELPVGIVDEN
ncbi:unnamed protein product [Fusarium graminearum]|uniref:Chromosome 4, complete genome n=2 Tax=Gibberella zeae TaxID=5518 RepID=A0A098DTM0_GIBZE|nr:unnamed protein product [Fusarium graminearum]CZS73193.1 unnamed protein product [Fusarium graminearum]